MMRRRTLRALTIAATLTLTSSVGTAALAVTPSDTGWQPEGTYVDYSFPACGSTLTVHDVVNKVESRTFDDGRENTLKLYRGKYVVEVSDRRGHSAVLDNSGPYSVATRANGDNIVTVAPPALIFPLTDQEPAAFRKAGLPDTFYYTKGLLNLVTTGDREKVTIKPANPVNVCKILR
jgi:hypothetical protein